MVFGEACIVHAVEVGEKEKERIIFASTSDCIKVNNYTK
jgi:hypothetical protein